MDWYRFHYALYKQDTMHLTPYQDGCYRRLIDHYMETRAPLPDNDAALARIIGDTQENWLANGAAIVKPFFCHSNGKLCHKRCDAELDYQDERQKNKSEAGKKGAEKRWKNNDLDGSRIAVPKDCYSKGVQEERRGEENRKDINIHELSISHIRVWLDEKRAAGKYLTVDEDALLERFKNYCLAKKPKYKDYVAAFRNAFAWDNPPIKKSTDYNEQLRKEQEEALRNGTL